MTTVDPVYSDYDPSPWYLKYNNQPDSPFYYYFIYNQFFDQMGYPLPNIADYTHAGTLQYWSAIFESPLVKAGFFFSVSNTIFMAILLIFFVFSELKANGFEGYAYSKDPANIDMNTAGDDFKIIPLSW